MAYRYANSMIKDGNMSFKWGDPVSVLENRKAFLASSGFDFDNCITIHTSDSCKVQIVTTQELGLGMSAIVDAIEADALITNDFSPQLFLVVADCAGTIFYDSVHQVLALVHLNGKNPGLIAQVIAKMQETFGTNPADIEARVTPAISKESFVVPDPFQREAAEWSNYIVNLDEHLTSIDMLGFLRAKMLEAGILDKNIDISDIDTYMSNKYFSHRRSVVTGEKEGRFAVVAKLV